MLAEVQALSQFDDDATFEVTVSGPLPVREKVKAPSRIVLEHALARAGMEKRVTITKL